MGKKIPLWHILVILGILTATLIWIIFDVKGVPHIPLIITTIAATLVAIANEWKWSYIEKGIINNISRSMQSILILLTVGILIGTWIAGGIVPAMIYYGLMILKPNIFLIACTLICSIVSLATGSSWTTVGTVGIALIGIGSGLEISPPMTAGAIISGAYFGDKMSPLSDTTNLAPAMAGATLFDHIQHMVYTVTPSLIITLIIFGVLGAGHSNETIDMHHITLLKEGIKSNFIINPMMLFPPCLVIIMVIFKIPALPGLLSGVILGIIYATTIQGISPETVIANISYSGYISETGNSFVDALLTHGGMSSMYHTVGLIIIAMCLGGVLDCTDMLKTLCESLLKLVNGTESLIFITLSTCIVFNFVACDQYLSIVLPGRMYKNVFENKKLKLKNLSRCLEDAGTVTSPLCPWNTCGSYMSTTLGVTTLTYAPYCFLNLINPIISCIYGFTGFTIAKMSEQEYDAILSQRKLDKELASKALF